MRYFTSDMHFGDTRLNLFGRDLVANNHLEIERIIITNWNKTITSDDTVYVIGDVALNSEGLNIMQLLNGNKILVRGNYDQQFSFTKLEQYFSQIYDHMTIYINDEPIYLNHYPTNCKSECFNITGHVHGTWKVQRNMINVGTDAWHFIPVSEDMIKFQMNGIRKHYDQNVFAGEMDCNMAHKPIVIMDYKLN